MMFKSWKTFSYFLGAYPLQGGLMIAALTVAGVLEGIGIAALLPLIVILTGGETAGGGEIAAIISNVFATLSLTPTIPHILLFIVGVMVIKAAISFLAVIQIAYTSAHVSAALRNEYITSLLSARWLHYIGLQSGAGANALGLEAERAAVAFKLGCQSLSYTIQIAIYGFIGFFVSWHLTFAAFFAGSILLFLMRFMITQSRRAGHELTVGYDSILSLVTDSLFGAKPLKAMGKDGHLGEILKKNIADLQSSRRRLELVDQSLVILSEPIMVVFVSLGLYAALTFSNLPMPELLFMAVLFLRMVMRIASAQRAYQSMVSNESALWSLRKKIDSAGSAIDDLGGTAQPSLAKNLAFKNVSFSYQGKPVLQDLNLDLAAGKFHLVFGPSGAGKTTLVDLATALLKPDSGDIYLDGQPMSAIDKKLWRQRIGYVPQDVLLFHDSVHNNVTLNDPTISKVDVEEALKKSGAWDFVSKLEQGLDTVVGERGSRLSGGQRQRLALARAIVHHPALLILDEATSALDRDTENAVLDTVKKLSRDMLVLAISHNQNLIDCADSVYYLRDGKISQGKE